MPAASNTARSSGSFSGAPSALSAGVARRLPFGMQ
jgi:hypothetical protein